MPIYGPKFPICIDLDGTLVKEHTLWHLNLPWDWSLGKKLFPPLWPLIKSKMANACDLNQTKWTYHALLIKQLQHWHEEGAHLYLVTGAPEKIAQHVADQIGLFSDVWASSGAHNLVGGHKASHLCHQFGAYGYTYVGDSWKDCAVWKTSKDIITVAPKNSLLSWYLKKTKPDHQGIFHIPHPEQQ